MMMITLVSTTILLYALLVVPTLRGQRDGQQQSHLASLSKPIAWIINLDARTDRWKESQKYWRDYFTLNRSSATISAGNSQHHVQSACSKSHIDVLRRFEKLDPRYGIVFEDDLMPTKYWDTYWPKIFDMIEKDSDSWDFIGLDPLVHIDSVVISPLNKSENFIRKVTEYRNMGGIIYSSRFIRSGKWKDFEGRVLDMTMTHNATFTKLIPTRMITKQSQGYSDIEKLFKKDRDRIIQYNDSETIVLQSLLYDHPVRFFPFFTPPPEINCMKSTSSRWSMFRKSVPNLKNNNHMDHFQITRLHGRLGSLYQEYKSALMCAICCRGTFASIAHDGLPHLVRWADFSQNQYSTLPVYNYNHHHHKLHEDTNSSGNTTRQFNDTEIFCRRGMSGSGETFRRMHVPCKLNANHEPEMHSIMNYFLFGNDKLPGCRPLDANGIDACPPMSQLEKTLMIHISHGEESTFLNGSSLAHQPIPLAYYQKLLSLHSWEKVVFVTNGKPVTDNSQLSRLVSMIETSFLGHRPINISTTNNVQSLLCAKYFAGAESSPLTSVVREFAYQVKEIFISSDVSVNCCRDQLFYPNNYRRTNCRCFSFPGYSAHTADDRNNSSSNQGDKNDRWMTYPVDDIHMESSVGFYLSPTLELF